MQVLVLSIGAVLVMIVVMVGFVVALLESYKAGWLKTYLHKRHIKKNTQVYIVEEFPANNSGVVLRKYNSLLRFHAVVSPEYKSRLDLTSRANRYGEVLIKAYINPNTLAVEHVESIGRGNGGSYSDEYPELPVLKDTKEDV